MSKIRDKVQEYNELRNQAKLIKTRMDSLAKEIKLYLSNTVTPDSKGSYYEENDDFVYGSQAKKSIKINEDRATALFKKMGVLDKVVDIKTVINEDKVSKLVESGELTVEELEQVLDTKVTYSIDIKEKTKSEDMPVVDKASSTKPKRRITLSRRR